MKTPFVHGVYHMTKPPGRRLGGPLLLAAAIALVVPTTHAQNGTRAPSRELDEQHSSLSRAQIQRMEARIATAMAIVNRLEPEAKVLGRASGWRRATLDTLLGLPLDQLQRVERQTSSLDSLTSFIENAAADPVLGDLDRDLLYFPITPCRFMDTRVVGGPIAGFRGIDLFNNGATYGGDASCDPRSLFGVIGNDFGAVALNVTLVGPIAAPGFVAVKPTMASPTTSVLNWYEAGPTVQHANQGIFTTDHSGVPEEFFIQTSDPVHVVLDIFGAFLQPHATPLQAVTNQTVQTIADGATFDFQTAACPAGYSLTNGGHNWAVASPNLWVWQSSANVAGNAWRCRGSNQSGVPAGFTCVARCARVPGR